MSARPLSVLSNYNPLTDPHLANHYSNKKRRKQLKSAGLIKKNGEIVSEREWLLVNQNKESKSHMKDLLAQAVVQKALEIERNRQVDIRNQLEMMAKKERVRRIRAERSKSDLVVKQIKVTSGAPRPHHSSEGIRKNSKNIEKSQKQEKNKNIQKMHQIDYGTLTMIKKEIDRNRAFQSVPSPFDKGPKDTRPIKLPNYNQPGFGNQEFTRSNAFIHENARSSGARLHRPEPGMIVKVRQQSLCEMKYKYIGRPGIGETAFLDPEDVVIEQQHCGGETIKVYHGLITPGQKINFTSRRHRGYPYSIVMYVNNIRIERISSCCEYKNKKGAKLGTGTLQFLSVQGAAPCFKCNIRKGLIKDKPDPAPRPVSRLSSKSEKSKNSENSESYSAPRVHKSEPEIEPEVEPEIEPEDSKTVSDVESDPETADEVEVNNESEVAEVGNVEVVNVEVPELVEVTKVDQTDKIDETESADSQYDDESLTESDSSDESSDDSSATETTNGEVATTDKMEDVDVTITNIDDITDEERTIEVTLTGPSDGENTNRTETENQISVQSPDAPSLTTPTANHLVDEVLDRVVADTVECENDSLSTTDPMTTTRSMSDSISPVSITSPLANILVADTLDKITHSEMVSQVTDETETES